MMLETIPPYLYCKKNVHDQGQKSILKSTCFNIFALQAKSSKTDESSEMFFLDEERSESPVEKLTSYLLLQSWFSKESNRSESSRSSDRLSEEGFVLDQVK